MDDFVGLQFGNYLLTQHLGHGGFADVYLGEHRLLKMRAAIKIMHNQLNEQEFLEEARTIAALTHTNIVRVLEFDVKELSTYHRVSFLVMDYAPQGTLRNRHPRGSILPLATTLLYIQQIANALQYAHDHQIIHRDVKPENMLIDAHGNILLSDFGIAAIEHSTSSRITIDAIGTPFYMAPEQWHGQPRLASDQYSLGIVAYEWLSGQPPFLGNVHALPHQHNHIAPAPFAPTLRVPADVEKAIQRALTKNPDQRFPDIKTFAQALTQTDQVVPNAMTPINLAPVTPQQPIPPTIPAVVTPPTSPTTQANTPQPQASLDALYREGVKAQAQGNTERAVNLWQQVLTTSPNYGNGKLAIQVQELRIELKSIFVPQLRQQAENAHRQGDWQQEIAIWKDLLTLQPEDPQAEERIPIATHNEQYAWMYESAKHFIAEDDLAAARIQLVTLWQEAPYYGDPAQIAKNIPSITLPPSHEAQQEAIRRQQAKKIATKAFFSLFCTAGGIGASVGMFTQSWIWACATAILITLIALFIGHQKVSPWPTFIIVGVISIASALGIAIFASSQDYYMFQTISKLGIIKLGTIQQIYIGRQAIGGTIIGLIDGLIIGGLTWTAKEDLSTLSSGHTVLTSSIELLSITIIILCGTSFFGGGFGPGPGWPILLLGIVVGLLGSSGAISFVYVWTRNRRNI